MLVVITGRQNDDKEQNMQVQGVLGSRAECVTWWVPMPSCFYPQNKRVTYKIRISEIKRNKKP